MTQFCTALEVKKLLTGDSPTMSSAQDNVIINEIGDVTDQFNEEIRTMRGEGEGWTLLAWRLYGTQLISISGSVISGPFALTFGSTTAGSLAATSTATQIQAATDAICGAGNTVVTGAPGGPWTVTFAGTLSGAQPLIVATDTFLGPQGASSTSQVLVEEMIAGSAAGVTNRYTGRDSSLLIIDDFQSVESVRLIHPDGTLVRALTLGTDYLIYPMNSLPIVGLTRICGRWDDTPGGVSVTGNPGYCQTVPGNIHKACIEEVIRGVRGGSAGVDDRLGTEPFAQQTVTRAFLASTNRTLYRYRFGGGMMRG
jgi:hypothetical protein